MKSRWIGQLTTKVAPFVAFFLLLRSDAVIELKQISETFKIQLFRLKRVPFRFLFLLLKIAHSFERKRL